MNDSDTTEHIAGEKGFSTFPRVLDRKGDWCSTLAYCETEF